MTTITNEVLSAKQDAMAQRLEKMELKIDAYAGNFVTREIFELRMKELEVQLKSLNIKLASVEKRKNIQTWLTGTLSAIFGSIMTFLTFYFFEHVGRK